MSYNKNYKNNNYKNNKSNVERKTLQQIQNHFCLQNENKKTNIEVGNKVFDVKRGHKNVILANKLYLTYVKNANQMSKMAQDLEQCETEEDTLELSSKILELEVELLETCDDIITLILGPNANDYLDDVLNISVEDKQNLAMTVYQLASGQKVEEEEKEENPEFFRQE